MKSDSLDTIDTDQRQTELERRPDSSVDHQPCFPRFGRLTGKVAIVTGGGSIVGHSTAIVFGRGGQIIYICKCRRKGAEGT